MLVRRTLLRFLFVLPLAFGCVVMTELAFAKRHKKPKAAAKAEVNPEAVVPPKADEVCFSPEEPCDWKLVKFIQGAETSLDVAVYDLNLDQVVHWLAVQSRKIPVRVVVDQRQSKGSHSLVETLAKAGVAVRYGRQRGIMHNKFIVRDGTMVETGSFNYTNHAAGANSENQIYLATPSVVERYKTRFARLWAEASPVSGSGLPLVPSAQPSSMEPKAATPLTPVQEATVPVPVPAPAPAPPALPPK